MARNLSHQTNGRRNPRRTWLGAILAVVGALPGTRALAENMPGRIALSSRVSGLMRLASDQQTDEKTFIVDDCSLITVEVSVVRDNVAVSVRTPGGQWITPGNVEQFGGGYMLIEGAMSGGLLTFSTRDDGRSTSSSLIRRARGSTR